MAAIITEVYTDGFNKYHVVYAPGRERVYNWRSDLPETARKWLKAHEEPEPEKVGHITAAEPDPDEYQEIQDSMTESFYKFCTGEPAPENWREIVQEERFRKKSADVADVAEAVEIILEDITEDPEYHDTPIPPRSNPDPELPAPTGKPGRGAAESVAFGLCLGLAYAVYGAREMIELMILTIQVLWIRAVPLARRAGKVLYVAWLEFYPVARQTTRRTVRIAAKQAAMAVWWLWVVSA